VVEVFGYDLFLLLKMVLNWSENILLTEDESMMGEKMR
jgi:hypothetical protein